MGAQMGDVLVGRYRLIESLGSGGFGETWKAYDELLGMDVAVKLFREKDAGRKDRYLREARALARYAGDPGVVAIRDLVETDEYVMLVMEHLDGQDLQAFLAQRGVLSLEETMKLIRPIANVVTRMHADGLLHRDISPDNIRVLRDGSARLLDFGSIGGTVATNTMTVKPGYAPPEQYATPDDQGPWTDVYALGATLYQCLTGCVPADSLQRTFHDELACPSQAGAHVSPEVDAAIMDALATDYRVRTQDVPTLMGSLEHALEVEHAPEERRAASEPGVSTAPIASPASIASAAPAVSAASAASPKRGSTLGEPSVARIVEPSPLPSAGVGAPMHPGAPSAASAAPSKGSKRGATRSKKRSGGGKGKLILAIVAALIIVVIGLLAIRSCSGADSGSGTQYRSETSTTSLIMSETISGATLETIANDEKTAIVKLVHCVVDDEAIKRLAGMDHVVGVSLNECTGFSTLAPLLESDYVSRIALIGYDDFDCAGMIPTDAPKIEFFQMRDMKIDNAGGLLEHFPGLTQLSLTLLEGDIDLAPIAQMDNLKELELSGCDLSGKTVDALANHDKLFSVEASQTDMESLQWAATCPNLTTLLLEGNDLDDISPLASCKLLDHVDLDSNRIADISALAASAPTLFDLEIGHNRVSDLSPLEGATALYGLRAADNKISDVSTLADCGRLAYLDLSENDIEDASPLGSCEDMKSLKLAHNRITDLNFCEKFAKLTEIDASFNHITDISKLASCSLAKSVFLQDNKISDISAFENGFSSLELLNIANNEVKSLEPLAQCALLNALGAYNNQITSLKGLENKPNLWILLADSNEISDISALSTSKQRLEYVDLGHNRVSDISALSDMFSADKTPGGYPGLGVAVLLDYNQVESIDSLPVRKDYRAIALHGNPLRDLTHLASEDFGWDCLYLPYVEGADYSNFNAYVNVDMNFVDVPYDKRAAVLQQSLKVVEPSFLTGEEAEAELSAYRAELYKRVSDEGEDTEDGDEGEDGEDDDEGDSKLIEPVESSSASSPSSNGTEKGKSDGA